MSIVNKIFTNTLWQVIIRAINILIGVFNLALITRILGQTGFGYFTTVFAFVQVFMVLADLGLYIVLLRELSAATSRPAENKIVNNIFTIRVITSLLVVIGAPLLVKFFPYEPAVQESIIYFIWAFFLQSLISTLTAVFSKKLEMPKVAITDLLNKLLFFSGLAYLFVYGGSLKQVLLLSSLAYFFAFILLLTFLKKHIDLSLSWDFVYWRKLWSIVWPLSITVVLNLVYFKGDTLILSAYASPEDVAIYGAPYRVLEVLVTFPHMFMSLILPLMTRAWLNRDYSALRDIFQNSFNFFAILGAPMVAGMWLISRPLMVLLAGPDFVASGPILNILVLAVVAIFFGVLFTYMIVAMGLQRKMVKYFLLVAILALGGYFWLIPLYSYWGAAYMTLAVETAIFLIGAYLVSRYFQLQIKYGAMLKSVFSAGIMFLLTWFIRDINLLLTIATAILVYVVMLYLTKAIDSKLLRLIFKRS